MSWYSERSASVNEVNKMNEFDTKQIKLYNSFYRFCFLSVKLLPPCQMGLVVLGWIKKHGGS